jgi:hypothetical protein
MRAASATIAARAVMVDRFTTLVSAFPAEKARHFPVIWLGSRVSGRMN